MAEEERATRVECLEATGESDDEEELIDVVGGGEIGLRSGAESEGFTSVDALRRAIMIAATDPETVLDTSGVPTCKYHLYDNLCLYLGRHTSAIMCSMQPVGCANLTSS